MAGKRCNSLRGRVKATPAALRFEAPERPSAPRLSGRRIRVLSGGGVVAPKAGAGVRARKPVAYQQPSGIREIDLIRAELAEARRRLRDYRARAGEVRDYVESGLAELAAAKGVRLEPADFARPEVIDRLPDGVKRIVDRFVADIDAGAAGEELYRTTRPIGKNMGRMI